MTKVIEIPGVAGNITVYKNGERIVISNSTDLDILVNGETLKAHSNAEYD